MKALYSSGKISDQIVTFVLSSYDTGSYALIGEQVEDVKMYAHKSSNFIAYTKWWTLNYSGLKYGDK
jgi:hypothetical protein